METGPGAGGEKAASQGFVDTGEEKTGASDLPGQSALLPKCQGSPGGCFGGFWDKRIGEEPGEIRSWSGRADLGSWGGSSLTMI